MQIRKAREARLQFGDEVCVLLQQPLHLHPQLKPMTKMRHSTNISPSCNLFLREDLRKFGSPFAFGAIMSGNSRICGQLVTHAIAGFTPSKGYHNRIRVSRIHKEQASGPENEGNKRTA